MKRIFIALLVGEGLQDEAWRFARDHENLTVRWLAPENLHITLVPPWEAEEDEIEAIQPKLESTTGKYGEYVLSFKSVSFGPDPHNPRLIWAEGSADPELAPLISSLNHVLKKPSEHGPFRLHLTLARFRPEDFSKFPVRNLNKTVAWEDAVSSLVLMESRSNPGGAEYEVLQEVAL
ncbi:MAG: RNA 2',3'-cyclic phosphodiesterase [Candidatus Liptonbacteria bacterium]